MIGVSARALAQSAVRAHQEVVAVDYFGDRDLRRIVATHSTRDFGMAANLKSLVKVARRLETDAVVYTASFENHPRAVKRLARGRDLLGNAPDVLRRVRDWTALRSFCHENGIRYPTTLKAGEESRATTSCVWLRKPVKSGGGHDITPWNRRAIDRNHLLQSQVDGVSASAAFVADGRKAIVIGVTEQLVGLPGLGARGFTWCGNLLPLEDEASAGSMLRSEIGRIASLLAAHFGLCGVNGFDFIVGQDTDGSPWPYLLEVNPRYSASMELMEAALGRSIYEMHFEGLAGRLPAAPVPAALHGCRAKGVVYAKQAVRVPNTDEWLEGGIQDVPFSGERIDAGHPVCTVFAEGEDRRDCLESLHLRAAEVYAELDDGRGA